MHRPGSMNFNRGRREESEQRDVKPQTKTWTPNIPPSPFSSSGRSYSPDRHAVDMDVEDDHYPRRLTAHVAPVTGRSMSPDTTNIKSRSEQEDDYLYGGTKVEPGGYRNDSDFRGRNPSWGQDQRRPPGPPIRPTPQYPDSFMGERDRDFRSYPPEPEEPRDIFDSRRPGPSSGFRGPPSGPYANADRISRPPQLSGESMDIDAGRRPARVSAIEENKNFSKTAYPARGLSSDRKPIIDERNKVPIYEMSKIPKKPKDERESEESEDDKIRRLKTEQAKKELQIAQLKQLVDRTIEKENDLRRLSKGRALGDNKEFCDNKKLQMDAQKRLDAYKVELHDTEIALNAILEARKREMLAAAEAANNYYGDENSGPGTSTTLQSTIVSTDYLDKKREETEEFVDGGVAKIEYFDEGEHWCEPCGDVFCNTVSDFLAHLHSEEHVKNVPQNKAAPWPLVKRCTTFDDDRAVAALRGSQFMIPCKGFFCAVCREFFGDAEAGEEHLHSYNHNRTYTKFLLSKPEYEHVFNKDKITAKAKAQANIRKRKREAEEKRQKEEEEKRKKLEDERKRKEKEEKEKLQKVLDDNDRRNKLDKLKLIQKKDKTKKRAIALSSSSSSSSSRESSPERKDPYKDAKLKQKCIVEIPKEEMKKALKAYGKMSLKAEPTPKKQESLDSPASEPPAKPKDESESKSESRCSTPSTLGGKEDESVITKKVKISSTSAFDDDEDESANFNLASVLTPSALLPDDNAVNSPASAGVLTAIPDLVTSETVTKPSPQKSPAKKVEASELDAIYNALENEDEDENEASNQASLSNGSTNVITGKDVQLKPLTQTPTKNDVTTSEPPETESFASPGHSFPQLSLDDLTKSPQYDDI